MDDVPVRFMGLRRRSIDYSEILKKGNPENEAALFPNDSSSDDGPTTSVRKDTNNNKSTYPKQLSRSLKPNGSSHITLTDAPETNLKGYKGTLAVLPEETPVKNSTHKKPAAILDDARSTGDKSPGDTNVTINITMTTKDVETVHDWWCTQ